MATIAPITEQELEKLKAQNKGVFEVNYTTEASIDGEKPEKLTVYVRRASRIEYTKFQKELFDDDRRHLAMENLACACVVYPSPEKFEEILDELPAMANTIADRLIKLAGGSKEATVKKR